jgi:hypothetical protein
MDVFAGASTDGFTAFLTAPTNGDSSDSARLTVIGMLVDRVSPSLHSGKSECRDALQERERQEVAPGASKDGYTAFLESVSALRLQTRSSAIRNMNNKGP